MCVRAKLVVHSTACEHVLAVHLRRGQSQDEARGARMAEHALAAAGVMPDLLTHAARNLRILDLVRSIQTFCADEDRIRLVGVPSIRISEPLVSLLQHDSCLDVPL